MEFLVDRSLGRKRVPDALRAHGTVVRTLWDVYGDAEQRVSDVEYLSRGDLTGEEQAARLVANLRRIEKACQQPGPFIYSVHPDRIERKWP